MRAFLLLLPFVSALCAQDLAIVHARIYTDPEAAPIQDATLVVRDGWISALGPSAEIHVPSDFRIIDASGMTALAGFWNSHVHFTESTWQNAHAAPAARLAAQLADMLASHGFTAVFDLGSDTGNTNALRERVQTGEIAGPLILTTGTPLAPENGSPYYLLPERLPEVQSPQDGLRLVHQRLDASVDGIKLFTGSWVSRDKIVTMPVAIVAAITGEAHRYALPVFAHPSDAAGLRAAVDGGVDILAHAEEAPGVLDPETLARMKERNIALIPTLKLFSQDGTLPAILRQVKSYSDLGGQILFGTDVGYLTDYDPVEEYRLLAQAGLTFRQILAALTTAPASRFGYSGRKGRLRPGMDGDIVILGRDPAESVQAFSDVQYCIRAGSILFARRHST